MKYNEKNVIMPYAKYLALTQGARETKAPNNMVEENVKQGNKKRVTSEEALVTYLQQISNRWNRNNKDELIIDDKPIPGTRVKELIRYMRGKSSKIPTGWKQFRRLFKHEKHLFTKKSISPRSEPTTTAATTTTTTTKDLKPPLNKSKQTKKQVNELSNRELPPAPPSVHIKRLNKEAGMVRKKKGKNVNIKWITLT